MEKLIWTGRLYRQQQTNQPQTHEWIMKNCALLLQESLSTSNFIDERRNGRGPQYIWGINNNNEKKFLFILFSSLSGRWMLWLHWLANHTLASITFVWSRKSESNHPMLCQADYPAQLQTSRIYIYLMHFYIYSTYSILYFAFWE